MELRCKNQRQEFAAQVLGTLDFSKCFVSPILMLIFYFLFLVEFESM